MRSRHAASTYLHPRYEEFLETIWPKIGRNEFYHSYVSEPGKKNPTMKALHQEGLIIKCGKLATNNKYLSRWKLRPRIADILENRHGSISEVSDLKCKEFNNTLQNNLEQKCVEYRIETKNRALQNKPMRVFHDQEQLIRQIYELVGTGEFTYKYLILHKVPVTPGTSIKMSAAKLFEKTRKNPQSNAWYWKLTPFAIQAVQK